MADCGASGSALDRAARVVLGASSNSGQQGITDAATKHVGTFIGHATLGASLRQHAPMPVAAPDHLVMPGPERPVNVTAPVSSAAIHSNPPLSSIVEGNHMDAVWKQQSSLAMPMTPPAMQDSRINHNFHQPLPPMHISSVMHHPHLQYHHHHQQQQQQMMMQQQFMMIQHQQQQLQNQKELQQNMHAQEKHLSAPQNEGQNSSVRLGDKTGAMESNSDIAVAVEQREMKEPLDTWHTQLEEDFENAVRGEGIFSEQGYEGIAKGASIEELANAWAEAQEEYTELGSNANLWNGTDDLVDPLTTYPPQYEFTYKDLSTVDDNTKHDWMEEGMKLFREGNLKEAIRSFEMELQIGDPDNAAAWRMLGRCHAENDQDREAISCLEQAVERDPYSLEALLALGVSYVNELDHDRALTNLKLWITHNPKYAGLELGEDVYGASSAAEEDMAGESESRFDEVQRLLLRALEYDSTDAADIWEALGVVYNVSRDYDAAVNAFRKAMEIHPEDYQLWNKLGATLANSNQSDKALPAYHKALELKPKYARAWLNMAISHSNLEDFNEAARCYLQTLSLNPSAVHCWSYLRVALSCSENYDLLPFVSSQDLSKFREHFDFVMYDDIGKAL